MYCLMEKFNVFRTDRDIVKAREFPGTYPGWIQSPLEIGNTWNINQL